METGSETILYAEDSKFFRQKTSEVLSSFGYNVIVAKDGKEAIDIYDDQNTECDLILSDIIMPHVDGIGLAQHNYRNKLLPFVVYTSVNETKTALKFLKYGVHDYLEKPSESERLISVINNAINRWSVHKGMEKGNGSFAGNLHAISFPTRKTDLAHANAWVMSKIHKCFDAHGCDKFMSFFDELLCNAYEHGNLKVTEEQKSNLILEDTFEDEMNRREKECKAKITVELSFLSNNIAVKISDEGVGFDYEKYLYMTEDDLIERLCLPNGRGLLMAKNYFDVLRFTENGSSVFFSKRIQ